MNNSPCCEKCKRMNSASNIMLGERNVICVDENCSCHSNSQEKQKCPRCEAGVCSAHQPSEAWEAWVRTLANSTNPKDVDLLIAKVSVLIAEAREEGLKQQIILKTDAWFEKGRTAALIECLKVVEGKKIVSDSVDDTKADLVRGYNTALSDLKQQITSLLK